MASPRLLKLRTSDDQIFEVEEGVIALSVTIKNLIDDGCADGVVPLTNVWSGALAKVIEWCRKHSKADGGSDELKKWDEDFIQLPNNELYDLILAANYLNVKDLLDLGCQRVADMIKGKNPEQIRKVFGIQNDFTPEEEEEIRKENSWAFE